MGIVEYRNSASEKARIADLMRYVPANAANALDIGARDGFISRLLADRIASVTALDLAMPVIEHERIHCVQGDVTALCCGDLEFDFVVCAEVLEHMPGAALTRACNELSRVSRRHLLIGVPYKQDIRLGRATCNSCGGKCPPWGHVNSFDERRLGSLFATFNVVETSFVGTAAPGTNFLSAWLMDLAGNPNGTYGQEWPCVHCGAKLTMPPERSVFQKVCTRVAYIVRNIQVRFSSPQANWIHMLLERQPT